MPRTEQKFHYEFMQKNFEMQLPPKNSRPNSELWFWFRSRIRIKILVSKIKSEHSSIYSDVYYNDFKLFLSLKYE